MSDVRQQFVLTIASGTDSASVDTGQSPYKVCWVNNQATAEIAIQGSGDGTNYYQVKLASGVINWTDLDIASAQSGNYVQLPALPRYVKVVATGTVANGGTVYLVTA